VSSKIAEIGRISLRYATLKQGSNLSFPHWHKTMFQLTDNKKDFPSKKYKLRWC